MGELAEVPLVLCFEADENTLIERIVERSKESGRNDDNIEVLRKRLETFRKETMPIVEFYEE